MDEMQSAVFSSSGNRDRSMHIEQVTNGYVVTVSQAGSRVMYVIEDIKNRDNVAVLLGVVEEAMESKNTQELA